MPGEPAARLALAPVTMVPRPMPATLPEAELALAPGSVRLTLSARLPGAVMASAPNRSDTAVWPTVPADVLACAPVRDTGMVAVDWPSGEAGRPSDLRARDLALNNQAASDGTGSRSRHCCQIDGNRQHVVGRDRQFGDRAARDTGTEGHLEYGRRAGGGRSDRAGQCRGPIGLQSYRTGGAGGARTGGSMSELAIVPAVVIALAPLSAIVWLN